MASATAMASTRARARLGLGLELGLWRSSSFSFNLLLGHGGQAVETGRREPRHSPGAVLVPLLALEVAENEAFHAPDHLLLRYEPVLLGDIVNPVELAASGQGIQIRLSICVGIGKGAAGGKTSAPAVEDALHLDHAKARVVGLVERSVVVATAAAAANGAPCLVFGVVRVRFLRFVTSG